MGVFMKIENNTILIPEDLEGRKLSLPITADSDQFKARLEFISSLKLDAQTYHVHIDKIRQRNLNITLLVFAGLFGISVSISNIFAILLAYAVLVFTMFILRMYDIKNHKASHGWRCTWFHLCHRYNMALESPKNLIDIELYRLKGEETAEKCAAIPIFYLILLIGSILLFILTLVCILGNIDFPFKKII